MRVNFVKEYKQFCNVTTSLERLAGASFCGYFFWGIMGRGPGVTLNLGKRKTLRHTSRLHAQAYHDLEEPFKRKAISI